MKLSDAFRAANTAGWTLEPDDCLDLESPDDDVHSSCCSRAKGHEGKHHDFTGYEW